MNEGDIVRMSLRHVDEISRERTKYLAAKHAADTLTAHEITDWVDSLTDAGMWVDSFLDIMDADVKSIETLSPIFTKCLSELGIRIPSQEQYLWWFICYHLKRIVTEEVDPVIGVFALKDDTWNDPHLDATTPSGDRRSGGSHDLFHFVSLYYQYDDVQENYWSYSEAEAAAIRRNVKERIKQEARSWLAEHRELCD